MALALALAVVAPSMIVSQEDDYRPPREFNFGLMGVAMREDLTVYQGGARDAEGEIVIKAQDRLLKWNGEALKTRDDFCRRLYATKPGDIVEVEFSRPVEGDEREILSAKIKLADPRETYSELYTHLDKRKRSYDWRDNEAVTKGGPLREKLWPLIEKHKLERDWDNLIAAHERELDLWDSYENLSSTDLLLSDPLSAHQWIEQVGNDFEAAKDSPLETLAAPLAHLLDREPGEWTPPERPVADDDKKDAVTWWKPKADLILGELSVTSADALAERYDSAEELGRELEQIRAFEFASRGTEGFAQSTTVTHAMRKLGIDAMPARSAIPWALAEIRKLARSFWTAQQEGDAVPHPKGVDMLPFVEGEAVCFRSSYGLIAVGGPGRNVWTGGPHAPAVIVDLGGDDEYIDCATTRHSPFRVSMIIDLDGDDHYRSTGKWGVACGMLGTAIIDDHKGDDTYECGDWGIGAAFGGVGLVIDREGNDRYLGGTNSIGCAAYGVGGVIDMQGNDVYDSHALSVGCGQPGGVGFVLDHDGDDRYRCTGEQPSPYGTEGEWFGGGIGCGYGWRTLACGGVGLVVDVKGNDIYDAGEFGLACGYFMGVGAVRDMDGDDVYRSSRYGLAAGAHAAVGVFMDDSGDDIYEGKTAASMSGAWDIVTTYFYDGGGDDVYRCDGLGLGGAAQNAFAIFWDAGGDDVYRSGRGHRRHAANTIGMAGQAEYAGGRLAKNFGIFMDTGGGEDSYPRDDRRNDAETVAGEYGLVLDE